MPQILGLGALYEDTILTIPKNLRSDSKQRATDKQIRIGGNIINTFHVLSEAPLLWWASSPLQLKFVGSVGTYESCKYLIADLESHDITPHLIHRAAHGPASAYIICSQEDGSRTIVSHTNSIPDPSAAELQSTLCETPDGWPEWIHVEGRNCVAVLEFLTHIKSLGFNGKISVDFERPRDGLRALLPQADVLFISRTYAEHLISDTPGFPHTPENPAEPPETPFVRRVLRAIENEIKPGASGHILLGAAGCFCFSRYDQENAVTETLSRVCSDLIQTTSSGQCQTEQSNGLFLFAFRRIGPLQTDVVESVGAGDSFVAGALWSYLNGSTWIDANAFATQIAGWKCTVNGFRGLWELLRGDNPRGCYA